MNVYLARLAPGESRRKQREACERIARLLSPKHSAQTLPWWQLRYQHTAALRTVLRDRYAPATANRHLAALRGVIRECWRLGLLSSEERDRACDVADVSGSRLPPGRALRQSELVAIFRSCAEDARPVRGARDAALVAVLYGCGLRREEACTLTVADLSAGRLKVAGKGNRQRRVPLPAGARAALLRWMESRGIEPGALLVKVGGHGHIARLRPMNGTSLYRILRRRARAAGVERFTPHDLRRTYMGDLLDANCDLVRVAKLMGHANITTTARYDRRPDEALARAAELVHVPYEDRFARTLALVTRSPRAAEAAPAPPEAE